MTLYATPEPLPLTPGMATAPDLALAKTEKNNCYHLARPRAARAICGDAVISDIVGDIGEWCVPRAEGDRFCENCGRHPQAIMALLRMLHERGNPVRPTP